MFYTSLFPKKSATVEHGNVTVNVEITAKENAPPKPEPPKPEPFDVAAYIATELAKQEATVTEPFNPNKKCPKCGAGSKTFPHKSVFTDDYQIYPHQREYDGREWFMSMPCPHWRKGAGYITTTCVRCGFQWKGWALDEKDDKR